MLEVTVHRSLLFVGCCSWALCLSQASGREWSDSTGKFKVDAELADVTAESVRLKKSSGEFTTVPLTRLSKADQDFVKQALELSSAAQAVLKQHCYSCHGQDGSDEGGMNYVLNGARLIEKGKVSPNQPDKSALLARIVAKEMPPEDAPTHPTAEEIQSLRSWISAGAFTPGSHPLRELANNDAVLEAIAADLAAADERSRMYYRYFTITHLYNAGLSDEELQTVRLALAKLLNSLSWDRRILVPQPIDPAQTVFRIDIRDLRWTRELWEVLVMAYPYGIQHSGKAAAESYRLSGTKMPHLRGDWFVAHASQPPLYHALLQLPDSLSGLQQQMKMSFVQNIRQDRVLRAGFTSSGVSQHPRLIERHDTADGGCWISYDFAGSAGQRNFFNNPLNFEFDGNEVIFQLPNGLQAFMIFDREGNRLDKAPTQIVRDLRSADATVVNGISCFRCHAGGVIPKQDEVRKHATANARAFGDRLKTIQALFPDSDAFEKQLIADQERYREALKKIGVTRFSPEGEPVFNVARRFREVVDVSLASAELGRKPEEFIAGLDRSVSLQKIVGPLRVPGGTMPRDAFEEAFGALVSSMGVGRYVPPAARIVQPGEIATNPDLPSDAPSESPLATADTLPEAGRTGATRLGLVHHWRFDETKGDQARDTQGRNSAALANWDKEDTRWVKGKVGNAIQFSKPEHIAITPKAIEYPQFTVTFWLQVQLEEGANPRVIHPWIALNYEKGQGVGVLGKVVEPTKPEPGEWQHYAVSIDQVRRNAVVYRNGVEVANGKFDAVRDPGRWVFGHNQDPRNHNDSFNGLLDDLRVYRRLLKPEEVEQLAGIAE